VIAGLPAFEDALLVDDHPPAADRHAARGFFVGQPDETVVRALHFDASFHAADFDLSRGLPETALESDFAKRLFDQLPP